MKKPVYGLSVTLLQNRDRSQTIEVSTKNISRLDVYLNNRPFKTLDTKDGKRRVGKIERERKRGKTMLLVNGFDSSNNLVAICSRPVERAR
jgi:hypothetical protein